MKKFQRGISILEILMVIVIVGVLSAVALPSFRSYALKTNRTEATHALTMAQFAQNRYRGRVKNYAPNELLTVPETASPPGLGQAAVTPNGYYNIDIAEAGDFSYTLRATAVPGSPQAKDYKCLVMVLHLEGLTISYASSSNVGDIPTSDQNRCWNR